MILKNCVTITNISPNIQTKQLIDYIERLTKITSCHRQPYTSKAIVELSNRDTAIKLQRLLNYSVLDSIKLNVILTVDTDTDSDNDIVDTQYSLPFQQQHNNIVDSAYTVYNKNDKRGNILLDGQEILSDNKPNNNDDITLLSTTVDTPCRNFISESEIITSQHVYNTYDTEPIGCTKLSDEHIQLLWTHISSICNTRVKTEPIKHETNVKLESYDTLKYTVKSIYCKLFTYTRQHQVQLNKANIDQLINNKQHYSVTTHPAGAEYILLCTRILNDKLNMKPELTPCYLIHMPDLTRTAEQIDIATIDTNIYLIRDTYFLIPELSTCILLGTLAAEAGITTHAQICYRLWCYDMLVYNNKVLHTMTLPQRLDTALQQLFAKQSLSLISTAHRLQDTIDDTMKHKKLNGPMAGIHTDIELCKTVHLMHNTIAPEVGMFGMSKIYPIVRHYNYHYQTPVYNEHIQQQLIYVNQLPYQATHIAIHYNESLVPRITNNMKNEHKKVKYETTVKSEGNSKTTDHTTLPLCFLYSETTSDISRVELLKLMRRFTIKVDTP